MTFDLRSSQTRILQCTRCDEPVAGEGWAGRVTLPCGYCGFEDMRELSAARALEDDAKPYRDARRGSRAPGLQIDLQHPPRILDVPASKLATLAKLRERWLSAKRAPLPANDVKEGVDRASQEYLLLWLAASVASHHVHAREYLRARAILETVLELVTQPAYRALVLARLARLAALSEAPELGAKWLDAAPVGLRIAEVTSDLKVADAMLARARGDYHAVLEIVGQRDTADEYVGTARFIALALRIDAHERLGDPTAATALWKSSIRGNAVIMGQTAAQFQLAPRTRARSSRRALVGLAGALIAVYGVVSLLLPSDGSPSSSRPLLCMLVGSLVMIATRFL